VVTEGDVAAYVEALRAETDDDGHPRFAPSSVARAVAAVRSFHRFCVEEGLVRSDPSEDIGGPRVPQGIPKALSEREVEALLAAVPGDDPRARRDRAILETLYAGGLRISELVGLDLGDVDLADGLARVMGKGRKERVVPLGRGARVALADYLRDGRPALQRRAARTDAVFLNARGGRLTRQGAWLIVRTAGERAGLGGRLFPHVLRHSCATHMLDHGADIRVVQELLGHASLSTTQVYTRVSPERLRAVYDQAHPRARRG
jgi:integrase/recombinase XerD